MPEKRPSELTFADYRSSVELIADSIESEAEEYPEDFENLHEAVWQHVDGSQYVIYPAYAFRAIQLSDQDPDMPDYTDRWTVYVNLDDRPQWSDVITAMAYVCLYSDVFGEMERREFNLPC